jgi:rhodanese-related sulfurtransferase/predicted transcriptional regulator
MASAPELPTRLLFAQFAAVAKTLANEHRLMLLQLLAQGERGVETLAELSGLSVANASQHLQHLRRTGVVTARRDGKRILYRLAGDDIVTLLSSLRQVAERNVAEVQRLLDGYFRERDSLEPIGPEELLKRMRRGMITLIDVRPHEEFSSGHISGAVSVPLEHLKRRLREIPPRREIVAYCRGPYCLMAYEAVSELRRRGFKARRLKDGYPEWKSAGLPVESS